MKPLKRGRLEFWLRQVALAPLVRKLRPVISLAAFVWRRLLFRTTFIAITGSSGKTTAKECLGKVLGATAPTFRTPRNFAGPTTTVLNMLRVRPWHRYAVFEVAVGEPGVMARGAALVRPDIAVILNVRGTHTTAFRDSEEHAKEKQILLHYLRRGGVALLFGDDALVTGMGEGLDCKVLRFGLSEGCDYRVVDVRAVWPGRLRFRITTSSGEHDVRTRLVGEHWAPAIAAVLAAAEIAGVGIPAALGALARVEPYAGRLQPMRLPGGAIMLRDDENSPLNGVELALRVLETACAARRILVISDISDMGMRRVQRLKYLAGAACGIAEVVVLTGRSADYGRRRLIEAGMAPENVHAFAAIRDAAMFLREELRPGDLALIKGRTTDHMARIYFGQLGPVGCWKEYCSKLMLCDICWELDITPEQAAQATVVPPPA